MDDQQKHAQDPLKADRQQTFVLDRPFVLTQDKTLVTGMPYLYSERRHHVAVRLLKVWKDYVGQDEVVNLTLQELQTDKVFTVSRNLDYEGDYYLWSLADLQSIMNASK